MSKLVWHNTGAKEFESGVRNVVLFVMKDDGTYENGVAWNGVTGIDENPGGADETVLYADDEKYASLRAAETFGCTISAYTYPDEFAECDGSKEVVPGVFLGQQGRKAFALVYQTAIGDDAHPSLDKGYKIHLVYNCTASPSAKSYATINDNPDAITFSWEASSTPVACKDHKAVSTITIDSTKVSSDKITLIKDAVFGSDNAESTMPTPDAVLGMLK